MKTLTLSGMLTLLVLLPFAIEGQMVCIAGKILDKITGETIQQLSVVERNSGIGTISSENGIYSLLLKPGKVDLTFFDEKKYEKFSASFVLKSDTILNIFMNALNVAGNKKTKKGTGKHESSALVAENPQPDKQ